MAEEYVIDSLVEAITRCKQAEPIEAYDRQQKCWVPKGDWKFDPANAIKAVDVLATRAGALMAVNSQPVIVMVFTLY